MTKTTRRHAIQAIGSLAAGISLGPYVIGKETNTTLSLPEYQGLDWPVDRPLTAVVIGAGQRGNVYASYAGRFPNEMKIVGVAEPVVHKRERFAEVYQIAPENCFTSWEYVFEKARFADAVIITTPDNLHYGPAMAAMPMGYDMILEKVIAQSWKECRNILSAAEKYGNIVAVCHVLRYTAYFRKVRELIQSGAIGDVISMQHFEPVENIHMSHSFVRGPWRNSKESNPMILSKSCHDTDIIRWLIDRPCRRVSSFGDLSWFKKENAPAGSPARCTDGCPAEKECPYSSLKVYLRDRRHLAHLNLDKGTDEEIIDRLKTTRYGQCVYQLDNDVVDHQVCNFEFDGGVTAAFSMEAMTHYGGRRTRIMGAKGHIAGDEYELQYVNFADGEVRRWTVAEASITSGHGGGDYGLVHDFIRASQKRDESLLTSNIQQSMESHRMGFLAEKSRLTGGKVQLC